MRKSALSVGLLGAVLIFLLGVYKEEGEKESYFRTKFNNEVFEKCIHEFKYWSEIQSEEVDIAFEAYLQGPSAQKIAPLECAMIFKLIEQGGVLGVAAEAHEKWEVLEYLKKGYSLEDIRNGDAHKQYKSVAHAEARFKEYRLYQFLYKNLLGENPPAMRAFLFVHPFIKIFLEDIYNVKVSEVTIAIMDRLVSEHGKYEHIMRGENCSREDIEKCIRFFEEVGFDYGNDRNLFLQCGMKFLQSID